MLILLFILVGWTAVLTLAVAMCVQAADGDRALAERTSGTSQAFAGPRRG
jgi:hypothetical protein